jgi:hypothetical protein
MYKSCLTNQSVDVREVIAVNSKNHGTHTFIKQNADLFTVEVFGMYGNQCALRG